MKWTRLVFVPVAAVALLFGTATPAHAVVYEFARMDGTQEVPGPGDANGTGAGLFDVFANPKNPRVCVKVRYRNIATPTAMHIHTGAAGVGGNILIDLSSVLTGTRCVATTLENARMIKNNPAGFYCNIHTGEFSNGAIRGQLELAQ